MEKNGENMFVLAFLEALYRFSMYMYILFRQLLNFFILKIPFHKIFKQDVGFMESTLHSFLMTWSTSVNDQNLHKLGCKHQT